MILWIFLPSWLCLHEKEVHMLQCSNTQLWRVQKSVGHLLKALKVCRENLQSIYSHGDIVMRARINTKNHIQSRFSLFLWIPVISEIYTTIETSFKKNFFFVTVYHIPLGQIGACFFSIYVIQLFVVLVQQFSILLLLLLFTCLASWKAEIKCKTASWGKSKIVDAKSDEIYDFIKIGLNLGNWSWSQRQVKHSLVSEVLVCFWCYTRSSNGYNRA